MKKIFKILPVNEQKNLFIFSILIVIVMVLETLSIGVVFPLIITILSDDFKSEAIYKFIASYTGNLNYEELILLLLVTVSLIFILKNIFILYLQWWKHGFTNRIQFTLQRKLLEIYLFQPYLSVIKKNTAIKVRNISTEASRFTKYFIATLTIMFECMVVISITILLFYLNPTVAIVIIGLVSLLTLSFYFVAKLKAVNWSKNRIINSQFSMKALVESLSSIKELRIFNKENLFLNKYSLHEKRAFYFNRLFAIFNDSPRIFLESVMVTILCVSIIYMINSGIEKNEVLATLGIFAVAGFRLFPSTTRIITCINELKSTLPSIDLIIKELNTENNFSKEFKKDDRETSFEDTIEFKNVSFSYPENHQNVIENFNLKIKAGSKIAIIGESGAGKSTLLNILIGFLKPNKGKIELDGKEIFNNHNQLRNIYSYVSQETFILDESVRFNITFNHSLISEKEENKLNEILEIVHLKDLINNLEKGLDTVIGEKGANISGGQRQRISIARAIFSNKEILILDEPTNELDEINEYGIIKKIFERYKNKTIILSTHNNELIDFCDVVLSMKDRKIEKN
tara:strand:- start:1002 stop:2714 length:1713 start_codon:yes stop_codon:yes gene_type:complete